MDYFKESRRLLQCLMKLTGVNILWRHYKPSNWTFIACLGIVSAIPILIGYITVNMDQLNLVQITEPIVTLLIYTRMCTYLVSMIGCSLKWKSLFDRIEKERSLSSMDDRFSELQERNSRKEYLMTKYFFITCIILFILITTVNVILIPNHFSLPINFNIPFLPIHNHSLIWFLNYTYQVLILFFAAITFASFATIMSILLNHSCWIIENVMIQIQLLNEYITDTNDSDVAGPSCVSTKIKSIKVTRQLIKIYMMHLRVLDFNTNVQNLIKFVLLTEFLIFRFAISFCIYILATNFFGSTYILLLLIVLLTQLFVCCYMGNRLKMQIDKLTNIVYFIKWDELEVNQQKVIIMLLRATQHMHEFNGIFTPLNFESFQQIFEASYSYLTLLRTMN